MKIGFDTSQTGAIKAGCGFFAENLIAHLASYDQNNHYLLLSTFGDHFWDHRADQTFSLASKNVSRIRPHTTLNEAKKFWQLPPNLIEKQLGQLDILHSNNFFCPPSLPTTKTVYTLYDLSFLNYPTCTTEHNRLHCFENVFKASLSADYIIAISEYTRAHFLKIFPYYPEDRIQTVYPASRFSESKLHQQPAKFSHFQAQKFWLNVGTLEPRKNVKRLLNAYAKLRAKHPDTYPLLIAGKQGWLYEDIYQVIADMNLSSSVFVLGYVSDEEMQWLYRHCYCFVYPSLFEGFGLPIIEAMTYGAPVIASNVSSMPEVMGNAGIQINPSDETEIFGAMEDLFLNPNQKEQLKILSRKQAEAFSWHDAANQVSSIYNKVSQMAKLHSDLQNENS